MKITKDTQTVWRLEYGGTIIGTRNVVIDEYFIRTTDNFIMIYTKAEMIEIYGLTGDQFDNIEKSGI